MSDSTFGSFGNVARQIRVPFERPVSMCFQGSEKFEHEIASDLSAGGMFIQTENPRPAGLMFDFELLLDHSLSLVEGRGQVLWLRKEDSAGRPSGVGIRFSELDDISRQMIEETVDRGVAESAERQESREQLVKTRAEALNIQAVSKQIGERARSELARIRQSLEDEIGSRGNAGRGAEPSRGRPQELPSEESTAASEPAEESVQGADPDSHESRKAQAVKSRLTELEIRLRSARSLLSEVEGSYAKGETGELDIVGQPIAGQPESAVPNPEPAAESAPMAAEPAPIELPSAPSDLAAFERGLCGELEDARRALLKAERKHERGSARLAEAASAKDRAKEQLSTALADKQAADRDLTELEAEARAAGEQLDSIHCDLGRAERESVQIQKDLDRELDKSRTALEKAGERQDELIACLNESSATVLAATERLETMTGANQSLDEDLAELENGMAASNEAAAEIESWAQKLESTRASSEAIQGELSERLSASRRDEADVRARLEPAMTTVRESETQRADMEKKVAECATSEASIVEKLPELTSARRQLQAERDASRAAVETAALALTAKMNFINGLPAVLLESESARKGLLHKLDEAKNIARGLRQSLDALSACLREQTARG